MKRRDFTKAVGLGVLATQTFPAFSAVNLIGNHQSIKAKIPIGLCNHSLRDMKLNAQQLIEYAVEQRLDSVLLNTFQPFKSLETNHLSRLNKIAKENEISVYIGAGSISEKSSAFSNKYGNPQELLTEGIRIAKLMDSPIVGCRIGSIDERYNDGGIEAHIEAAIKLMKSMGSRARDAGIKFAFENHAGDLRSKELLELINETGPDICGALYDPGNAIWAMEDPMEALGILGSNIICTSVRDVAVWESSAGATFQWMAIGEGTMDYPAYAKTMSDLCPGVPLHVETISYSPREISYLTLDFWKGFPNLSAKEIRAFLKLARNGDPLQTIDAPIAENKQLFDIILQQSELLKSFQFLKEYCNAGLKS